MKGKAYSRANVVVQYQHERGRSAFANRNFAAGDFVCEYASCLKLKSEAMRLDDDGRYQSLGLGCYSLDAFIDGHWWTFDATGTINDPGQYINHASRNTNLVLMKPMRIQERYRIGFVAKHDIRKGDELFYHYGINDPDIPWLISDARKMTSSSAENSTTIVSTDATNTYVTTEIDNVTIDTTSNNARKKPPKRSRLRCPLPDYASQQLAPLGLVKLTQHLKQTHRIADKAERCMKAKQVCGLQTM